jgi:hypothetical protein
LRRRLNEYVPTPFHSFTNEARGQVVVERLEEALRAEHVDHEDFDESTSSFHCKVIVDSSFFRFDVYVLHLSEECSKAVNGAKFIIEAQRTQSSGSTSQWSNIISSLMVHLSDLFTGGLYDHVPARRVSFFDSSSKLLEPDLPLLDDWDLTDMNANIEMSQEEIEKEYKRMIDMACCSNATELRVQMAEILARLSSEREAGIQLIRLGAIDQVIQSLQTEILVHTESDLVRLYCTVLSNIATFAKELQFEVPFELGAFTTMTVLKSVNSCSKLQMHTFREASRALAQFSSNIHTAEVRNQVRQVALSCAGSNDVYLVDNVKQVLRNLNVGCSA